MACTMTALLFVGILATLSMGTDAEYLSAFSVANVRGAYTCPNGGILRLPNILLNKGNNYNVRSGVYTAPVNGLYVFNLHAGTQGKNSIARMYIQAAGKQVARLWALDKYVDAQSAVSATVYLYRGQQTMVRVHDLTGTRLLDDDFYTVFSGYLLHSG